jgi:hypothetical protein
MNKWIQIDAHIKGTVYTLLRAIAGNTVEIIK